MARPLRALTCCALLSCSIGPGCGQLARISECKRFVRLANASTTELRAIDEANKIVPESATYEKLALRFERFAFDIDALRLADWELRKATAAINRTMQMAAKDCRSYADELREREKLGLDAKNGTELAAMRKLTKTRSRVELSLRGYEVQVRTVNEVCQPQ